MNTEPRLLRLNTVTCRRLAALALVCGILLSLPADGAHARSAAPLRADTASSDIDLYVWNHSARGLTLYVRARADADVAELELLGSAAGPGAFELLDTAGPGERFFEVSRSTLARLSFFYVIGRNGDGEPLFHSNLVTTAGLSFGADDFPDAVGTVTENFVEKGVTVSLDLAGPAWDYSQELGSIETRTIVTPASTGFSSDFPSATIATKSELDGVTDYNFYDNTDARLGMFGYVENAGTSNQAKYKFSAMDRLVVYPLSATTASWNDYTEFSHSSGATVKITNTKTVLKEGTVSLIGGTERPCILVRYAIIGGAYFGSIKVLDVSRYEYVWYVPGIGPAVRIQSANDEKNPVFTAANRVWRARDTQDVDNVPPEQVTDLAANGQSSAIRVGFTAPGDDGDTGTAASYQLRYLAGNNLIDSESEWSSATPVSALSTPKAAGSAEAFDVTGLEAGQIYAFAMKALDEAGNLSLLSNSATATTEAGTSTVSVR
ncbi:MAG: hypothetical protein HYV63_29325 [Candidatus Schekmanbacteria bacterium]|nr:hypothetical protein [Candidatus Schekmanbacteria bacterium]